MTAVAPKPEQNLEAVRPYPARTGPKGSFLYRAVTTTDPKMLGQMYLFTAMS
ncbi:hypothetical protein, partial [Nocardia uniformis]